MTIPGNQCLTTLQSPWPRAITLHQQHWQLSNRQGNISKPPLPITFRFPVTAAARYRYLLRKPVNKLNETHPRKSPGDPRLILTSPADTAIAAMQRRSGTAAPVPANARQLGVRSARQTPAQIIVRWR